MEITDIALIIGTLSLKRFHLKSLPEQHKEGTLMKQEKKQKNKTLKHTKVKSKISLLVHQKIIY